MDELGSPLALTGATALAAAASTLLLARLSSALSSRVRAYRALPRHHKLDLDSRLGSNVHAVASTFLAVACVVSLWRSSDGGGEAAAAVGEATPSFVPLALRTSPLSYAALGLSLGYFAADLALVLLHSPALGGLEVVGHHAAALASLAVAAATGHGHAHTLSLLASELTTPFVNARVYLERLGPSWKRGSTYAANGVAMLLAWAVARVGLFAAFFAHLAAFPGWRAAGVGSMAPPARALIAVVPPALAALNGYWFALIARGCWRTIDRRRKADGCGGVGGEASTAKETTAAATTPPPAPVPTAACSVKLEPRPRREEQQALLRARRKRASPGEPASPPSTLPPALSGPLSRVSEAGERAILHLWSLAPQPPSAALPSLPSLPQLPRQLPQLPSDLAARLARLSPGGLGVVGGEALAGRISAACRERAEWAQGFVADAWARRPTAAGFVR